MGGRLSRRSLRVRVPPSAGFLISIEKISRFELLSTGQKGSLCWERERWVSERDVPKLSYCKMVWYAREEVVSVLTVVAHLLSGPKVGTLCNHPSFICWRSTTVLMALSMGKV